MHIYNNEWPELIHSWYHVIIGFNIDFKCNILSDDIHYGAFEKNRFPKKKKLTSNHTNSLHLFLLSARVLKPNTISLTMQDPTQEDLTIVNNNIIATINLIAKDPTQDPHNPYFSHPTENFCVVVVTTPL